VDDWGLISSRSKVSFFHHCVHASSEVYHFVAEEWLRYETDHSPQTAANFKNVRSYTSIPSCVHDEIFNKGQRYLHWYSMTSSDKTLEYRL